MRAKTYLIGFICTVATTIVLLAFGDQRPKIQNLVSETHRQLKDNFKTIKDKLEGGAENNRGGLYVDEKYLVLLGLAGDKQRTYPDDVWSNTTLPVIVSYVSPAAISQAVGLVRNIGHFLPNHTLLLYNIGLSEDQLQTMALYCNSSRCVIVKFDLSVFPPHVSDEHLHAFRPLIIQDAVSRSGAIFYLENDQRLTTSDISPLVQRASSQGVLTWRAAHPVTALTHPRMLRYFTVPSESFFFTHMVEATKLLLYNTAPLRQGVMLPWVKCALNHDCIFPLGAQSVGCRFDKKPNYRYSGCHGNDASALSVLLGLLFNSDTDEYSIQAEATTQSNGYFRRVDSTEAALELSSMQDNSTDSTGL
ncbi:uncharacterized protein LOC106662581 [Cimex lectularius]|uniref:Uncharacterized protein n=1 Tax=Cimex lectularius TaxID=79782 RepID=A0A8I6RAR9_CIMLE|nr:uncharacterized protein LOC106662581 [Cimex lectularius]